MLSGVSSRKSWRAQIILAGRSINDGMTGWVARKCVKAIQAKKFKIQGLLMGLTFEKIVKTCEIARALNC